MEPMRVLILEGTKDDVAALERTLAIGYDVTTADLGELDDDSLRARLHRAREWKVALVLTAAGSPTSGLVARVHRLADEVTPGGSRLWRLRAAPQRPLWRRLLGRDGSSAPAPCGVEDRTVAGPEELRRLVEQQAIRLTRHKWYQRVTLGSITTGGPSDAAEKVGTVLMQDLQGRAVLDLCCATGAHGLLARQRGADRVLGIEHDTRRYVKALELRKAAARDGSLDAERVSFAFGDAFELLGMVGRFDTIMFFGAVHYFPDYASLLHAVAACTGGAAYIEFTFSEREHDTATAPGEIRAWTRSKSGTTIYMGDRPSVERVIAEAMPEFQIEERTPISPPGARSEREVWRLRRSPAPVAAPAAEQAMHAS